MMTRGHRPTSHPARHWCALLALLGLGACVDLSRPSVKDLCTEGSGCPSDGGRPDTITDVTSPFDRTHSEEVAPPDDVLSPDDVISPDDLLPPVDEGTDPPDGPPDIDGPDAGLPDVAPPDLPRDLPSDLAPDVAPPDLPRDLPPDLPADLAPDRPPDLMVDAPVAVAKGICPTGESALLLCLRFESSLADESPPAAALTGTNVSYEAAPGDLAIRLGTSSVVRANQGWGNVGSSFTLEAWVRPDRLPTGSQRMGLLDDETRFGLFILAGGTLACYSAGVGVTVPSAVRAGQWSAVTCTASSTHLTAWVDGVQRNQVSLDGSPGGATGNLSIGSNNPSGDAFEGLMDNVRLWNTVRNATQICQASLGCP